MTREPTPFTPTTVTTAEWTRRCIKLSEMVVDLRAKVARLESGLQMLAKQEYDAGYTPEGFAEAILSGDEPALEPKP